MKAEESVGDCADASSFDCDRDATTIEPLVSGQQLIALLCAGGTANSVNSLGFDCVAEADRFAPLRFALQQACASIDPDMCDIAFATASAAVSMSRITPWA
ncbi:MAG TPA: hypothetical protein VGP81_03955 [Pyrinomonadaceae bacterium]|nr:hypothetical protein [Pyrinomonadaceae bacterium]